MPLTDSVAEQCVLLGDVRKHCKDNVAKQGAYCSCSNNVGAIFCSEFFTKSCMFFASDIRSACLAMPLQSSNVTLRQICLSRAMLFGEQLIVRNPKPMSVTTLNDPDPICPQSETGIEWYPET